MRFVRFGLLLLLSLTLLNISLAAQNDKMTYAVFNTSKFGNLPVLPSCMSIASQHGDPFEEPAAIAAVFTTGSSFRGIGTRPERTLFCSPAKAGLR